MTVDDSDFERRLGAVPWDRISHFQGRASDVPTCLRALLHSSPHEQVLALQRLERSLEHQDGVDQATAFAVGFLVELASDVRTGDPARVVTLVRTALNAAQFTLSTPTPARPAKLPDLIAPDCLLPEYVDTDEDAAMFETRQPPEWLWASSALVTRNEVRRRRPAIAALGSAAGNVGIAAQALLDDIDHPRFPQWQ